MNGHAPTCPGPYQSCTCGAQRQRSPRKSDAPPPADITDVQLRELAGMFGLLVRRGVVLTRVTRGSITITQRCIVCGDEIFAKVTDHGTRYEITGTIGTKIRIAYLTHRCTPIESSLLGASYEELEELFALLERDSQRLATRAAEIDRLRRARVA